MKTPRGMSAMGTLLMFIFFLIVLGVLWVASGGPSRPLSRSGPFLSPPPTPGINYETGQTESNESQVDTTPLPTSGEVRNESASILDYFFNFRNGTNSGSTATSPYASSVALEQNNATASNPGEEYITIKTSYNLQKSLTISGWVLESAVSAIRAPIGGAAQIPFLGAVNATLPITVGPDSRVHVATGRSPNGTSFRVNKCTGYFEQFQDFSPYLSNECPIPGNEALLKPQKTAGDADCIDFVDRLSSCQMYTAEIPFEVGESCRDFIVNDLTYNGCINAHKGDPDFYRNEWRVFLNRDQELWANKHDQIRLWDENGKLIAEISY